MTKRTGLARKAAEQASGARWCLGADYEPLIRAQDVRSSGRKGRIEYQGREMHLLSDLEVRAFRHFQWEPSVFGIEEQFYLELDDTVRIAREAGAQHPLVIGTTNPFEMSTDLVVYHHAERGERRIARSIKYAKDIELGLASEGRQRRTIAHTLEKLEIERRYWVERSVDWAIMTEVELTETRTRNIENLLDFELDPARPDGFWQDAVDRVCDAMAAGEGLRMVDLQRGLETEGKLEQADFADCVRHLCATRQLEFDMERPLKMLRPVTDFQFATPALKLVR